MRQQFRPPPVIFLVALKCDYDRSQWEVDEAVRGREGGRPLRLFALRADTRACMSSVANLILI